MIQAFLDGKDMHAVTAELALGHVPDEHERLIAKNANFSEIYGAGIEKFADTAGISYDAAKRFKERYHEQYTRVKPFTKAVAKYARSNLFAIETSFGRRVRVEPDLTYAAVNYLIQGSAADVLKRAMVRLSRTEWGQYFRLPIHDELILDVPDELVDGLVSVLPSIMEDRETYKVPLVVEVSTAKRWGSKGAA
jgi:DNA polymerase-1